MKVLNGCLRIMQIGELVFFSLEMSLMRLVAITDGSIGNNDEFSSHIMQIMSKW